MVLPWYRSKFISIQIYFEVLEVLYFWLDMIPLKVWWDNDVYTNCKATTAQAEYSESETYK